MKVTIELTDQQIEHLKAVLMFYNQSEGYDDLFDFLNFQEKDEFTTLLREIAEQVHEHRRSLGGRQ